MVGMCSMFVILAFKSINIVPWHLRNRWKNCIELTSRMSFKFSHIFHYGNNCADKIASHGIVIHGFIVGTLYLFLSVRTFIGIE